MRSSISTLCLLLVSVATGIATPFKRDVDGANAGEGGLVVTLSSDPLVNSADDISITVTIENEVSAYEICGVYP